MNPQDFLHHCPVEVWPATYAVVKAKWVPDTFIMVFKDHEEITVVVKEEDLNDEWVLTAEQGWKMLSFRVTLPFELTGFLAVVSQALAEKHISIFALSAYSTDHLLIKQSDMSKAIDVLQSLCCVIKEAY
uniref:ACT domain-containing protein n=1 Tax=Roseihalotalea indica TaxID=2867963 RepID=A0AA49GQD7_9BACT|nr:ACT domain-containing protein [Tunicatimonas sp. TK19036]